MTRVIRASFAGSSGVGKSTLATWLSDELGLPLNPVGSRSIAAEMGLESPYDADRLGVRGVFQETLQARKIAWELAHESFVTDRTTLDELVYSEMHGCATPAYEQIALGHMARYTHVFYCPFEVFCDLGDDPKRNPSMHYQKDFDMRLVTTLKSHELAEVLPRVWSLVGADLEVRKATIRASLGLA